MRGYAFNKTLPLLLYGINQYSELLLEKLQASHFNVQGFIDKRAVELGHNYNNSRVLGLEDVKLCKDVCVIITLMNALNHEVVAMQLNQLNVSKILFLPMNSIYSAYTKKMCEQYNRIVYSYDFSEVILPFYDEFRNENIQNSYTRVIQLTDNIYTVYVPFNMVYTAFKENKKYSDKPILMFKPYRLLFDYLFNNTKNIDLYLQEYGTNSCNYTNSYTNDDILKQRKQIFNVWERHFYFSDGYFEAGAPIVKWNDKGNYFNLTEGQHRILYLILKGCFFVPVQMDKCDFIKSINVIHEIVNSKSIEEWKRLLSSEIEKLS